MTGEAFLVNSDDSLAEFIKDAERRYKEDRYTIYSWVSGIDRTVPQNKMFFWMYKAIGEQLYGNDEKLARAECKLTIGVPILRAESESFRDIYDKVIRNHDYETKLQIVMLLPVSSELSKKGAIEYINTIFDTYAVKGVRWPEMIRDQKEKFK